MGYAIAEAAIESDHDVVLISGAGESGAARWRENGERDHQR
jgi:hypothetical protein